MFNLWLKIWTGQLQPVSHLEDNGLHCGRDSSIKSFRWEYYIAARLRDQLKKKNRKIGLIVRPQKKEK